MIFISRLREAISLTHFEVGMIKAPFMALVIGVSPAAKVCGSRAAPSCWGCKPHVGGEVDLPGHRPRRHVRYLLRLDRDVTEMLAST